MNKTPPGFKLLREAPTHFEVQVGKQRPLIVPKIGLSDDLQHHIRGLGGDLKVNRAPAGYAEGGEVKGYPVSSTGVPMVDSNLLTGDPYTYETHNPALDDRLEALGKLSKDQLIDVVKNSESSKALLTAPARPVSKTSIGNNDPPRALPSIAAPIPSPDLSDPTDRAGLSAYDPTYQVNFSNGKNNPNINPALGQIAGSPQTSMTDNPNMRADMVAPSRAWTSGQVTDAAAAQTGLAGQLPGGDVGLSGPWKPGDAPQAGVPDMLAASKDAAGSASKPNRGITGFGGSYQLSPEESRLLSTAQSQQQEGINRIAGAVSAQAGAEKDAYSQLQGHLDTAKKDYDSQMQANTQKQQDLASAIENKSIDPTRFWNNLEWYRQASVATSLILGGIAAGINGGPNIGLSMIEKAIDRDLDSQKVNLGKKQTLLSYYLSQGKDIQQAHQLTKADLLDSSAAQLRMIGSQYAGQKAQGEAQMASGKLSQDAFTLRQDATARGIENKYKPQVLASQMALQGAQTAKTRIETLAQVQQMNAAQLMLQQRQAAMGSSDPYAMLKWQLRMDPEKEAQHRVPVQEMQATKDSRGNVVNVPVVTQRLALDPDSAKKAREGLAATTEQMTKLKALQDFARAHPYGGGFIKDSQEAKSKLGDFLLSWNKSEEGLNRVTSPELDMVKQMAQDPSSFWGSVTGKRDTALQVLEHAIQSRRDGIKDSYLIPGN